MSRIEKSFPFYNNARLYHIIYRIAELSEPLPIAREKSAAATSRIKPELLPEMRR
ncbi:hypothetical protein JCM10550A_07850 [Methanogenium cariaci]